MFFRNNWFGQNREHGPNNELTKLVRYRDSLREILNPSPNSEKYGELVKKYFDQAATNPNDTYADDLHHFADSFTRGSEGEDELLAEIERVNEELHLLDPANYPSPEQPTTNTDEPASPEDDLATDSEDETSTESVGEGVHGTMYPIYPSRSGSDYPAESDYPDTDGDSSAEVVIPRNPSETHVSLEQEVGQILEESFDNFELGTINTLIERLESLMARCTNPELKRKLEQHRNRVAIYRHVLRCYLDTSHQMQRSTQGSNKHSAPTTQSSLTNPCIRIQQLLKLLSSKQAKNQNFIDLINKLIGEAHESLAAKSTPSDIKKLIQKELQTYNEVALARDRTPKKQAA